jgi:integrin beta 3
MELSQLFVVVMKNVREFVQPALDATVKRMDESIAELRSEFSEKVAQIPAGKDGANGLDGKDGATGERGEAGEKGMAGDRGEPGERGQPGEKGLDGKDGAQGEPGARGEPGEKGEPGERGESGLPGDRGADGKSITIEDVLPVLESMQTKWALDFERRAQELFQRAIERMPQAKDGTDGKDALGFEDMTETLEDGGRFVVHRFVCGDLVKEFRHKTTTPIYRGIFKRGGDYSAGDVTTWGGHMYHADQDNDGALAPDNEKSPWTQCVKRGNDGSSAFQSAKRCGFVGSEQEWIDSIGKPPVQRTVKIP